MSDRAFPLSTITPAPYFPVAWQQASPEVRVHVNECMEAEGR